MSSMKISLRPDVCSGHARCQEFCPQVFGGDEYGYVQLKMTEIPPELQAQAREAAEACPEAAIVIDDHTA